MIAVTMLAMAAGCFYWVRHLVNSQTGSDHFVAGLVFAIPALIAGACACLARSLKLGAIVCAAVFGMIILLAALANAIVPMLK